MIGTLGRKIIFEVSDNRVLTFESMSREVSGRWTEHEVLGVKPKAEFFRAWPPDHKPDHSPVRCPGREAAADPGHGGAHGGKRFGGVPGDRRQTGGPPSVPRYRIE